jgi:uncharacterized OB-fold protein
MYSDKCLECGYIHPPTAKGQCPIANQEKVKQEAESSRTVSTYNLSTVLQKEFIQKSNTITDVNKINKLLHDSVKFIRDYIS